jgi:hypothetical protein
MTAMARNSNRALCCQCGNLRPVYAGYRYRLREYRDIAETPTAPAAR